MVGERRMLAWFAIPTNMLANILINILSLERLFECFFARNRIVRTNLSAELTIFVPMVDCFGVMYGSMSPKICLKDS